MIAEKKYLLPTTLHEAFEMAHSNLGFFKYLAGGTDVMVNRFQDNEKSPCLIDITRLPGLKGGERGGRVLAHRRPGAVGIAETIRGDPNRISHADRSGLVGGSALIAENGDPGR
ncbi:MAG: FAD binding domain-containing protein [Saprospirales bacterium]|nr:FAD binding domain-containing protein [Saprospirales bacterium]